VRVALILERKAKPANGKLASSVEYFQNVPAFLTTIEDRFQADRTALLDAARSPRVR